MTIPIDNNFRVNTSVVNRTDVTTANLYDGVAISVDHFLTTDSTFPQMLETLKATQRYPTVSGLQDSDYPNINDWTAGTQLSLSQFTPLTTIPLPKGLLEQFTHIQQNCEMGIMTEIRRAWVAIDCYIYLWNYDNASDVAYYDGLSETILSVGLVQPKDGVFKPHIKYLLVLTTAVEILLLGITFTPNEDDGDSGDLLLVPDPIFRISTDNIVMNVIYGSHDGRIFLGGRDGCVYEVTYQAEDGWFGRKCRKINHSSSTLSFLIPAFFALAKDDEIIQIDIDNKRHILYTLTKNGTIDVFDLGADGKSTYRVTSKSLNSIVNEASAVAQTIDQLNFKPIISINAIDESESIHINLIAVTKAGVRLYFTATSLTSPEQRPFALSLLHVRLPPGFTASPSIQRPTSVHCSYFNRGTLLMVSSHIENKDFLWTINNDSFAFNLELMELFSVSQLSSKIWRIAEETKALPYKPYHQYVLKNKVVSLETPLLVTQHMEEPRKFVFLTSQGIHIGYKTRIVDQLYKLLVDNQGYDNETVKAFFALHSGAQGCAIALILACGLKSSQEAKIKEWATSAFFHYGGDPQLTNSQMIQTHIQQPFPHQPYTSPTFDRSLHQVSTPVSSTNQPLFSTPSSPIQPQSLHTSYMSPEMSCQIGQQSTGAVVSVGTQFSNKHNAVYLYFSRIIRPFWSLKCVSSQKTMTSEGHKELLMSNISLNEIKAYDNRLTELRDFLKTNIKFSPNLENDNRKDIFKGSDIYANEKTSLYLLVKLIEHCIEVLGLWKLLCDHQFHAVTSVLPIEKQTQLIGMTFKDLVVYGNEMTTLLASALVRRFIEDNSTTDIINRRLQDVCPSIYKNENALHAKAHELVMKAKSITNPTDRSSQLETALNLCKKIGARINLPAVCELFQSVHMYEAVVDICLLTAQNRDPQNLALHYYKNGEPIEDQMGYYSYNNRNECYKLLLEIYERLVQQSKSLLNPRVDESIKTVLSLEEAKKRSNDLLSRAIESNDELFHISLYNWLYEFQQSDKLLEIKSPYLENYLKRKTSAFSDSIALMDLLWMYYERNGHYRAAAHILTKLAERHSPEVSLYKRLEYLSRAIVCMKSSDSRPTSLLGDDSQSAGEKLHELEEKMEVARIQLQILEHIQKLTDTPLTHEAINALNSDLLEITSLYEEFAERFNLPECQLAILHCAGHYDPNLIETIWHNIFDNDLRAIHSLSTEAQKNYLTTKIRNFAIIYANAEKYFPIEFIVKYLETKTQNIGFEAQWLAQCLLSLDIKLSNLLNLYHKLYRSRELSISWPRKQIHLLRILTYLIDTFTQMQQLVDFAERRQFCNKTLDIISGYLLDLQTMDTEDKDVKNLLIDLKSLKSRVERCL